MSTPIRTVVAFIVFMALPAFAPDGWAQVGNVHGTHFLTFEAPIALPNGTVLPAGTYLFSWDPQQHITRISSEDRSTLYATLMAIPTQRPNVKEHDIVIERASANAPPTLKAWFCPGNPTGHQFASVKK